MPKDTVHRSYRLTPHAAALLEKLAAQEGCSQTAIVERAIRTLARHTAPPQQPPEEPRSG